MSGLTVLGFIEVYSTMIARILIFYCPPGVHLLSCICATRFEIGYYVTFLRIGMTGYCYCASALHRACIKSLSSDHLRGVTILGYVFDHRTCQGILRGVYHSGMGGRS
jgi:hypothetical protein